MAVASQLSEVRIGADVLEQLETVTAQRDALAEMLHDVLVRLVDRSAHMWAEEQELMREAEALVADAGVRMEVER